MSKESALSMASQNQPPSEVRTNPITGNIPENAKQAANPAVENAGVVPQPLQSTQLAHLAKKESKLLADRQAFQKEQEEFKTLKARVQEVYDKAQAFEKTRKEDPIKALREVGFTEKEIVDYLSQEDAPKPSTEEVVQAEIKKFKDEEAQKVVEAQKTRDQQLVEQYKSQIPTLLAANPEKFELCHYYGSVAEELIFETAIEWAKAGKTPDTKAIAEDVEEYYEGLYREAGKLKKFAPAVVAPIIKTPERSRIVHPPQEVEKPKPTTLTNRLVPTGAAVERGAARKETPQEKRARLEAMLRAGFTK